MMTFNGNCVYSDAYNISYEYIRHINTADLDRRKGDKDRGTEGNGSGISVKENTIVCTMTTRQ